MHAAHREKIFIEHYADLLLNFVLLLCRVQAEQGDLPAILFSRFKSNLSVVLLPAPFSPIRPMMQPCGRLKLTFFS